MPAVVGYHLAKKPALFIQNPDRTLAVWSMVNIDNYVTARMVGYDVPDVYGLEMMSRHFPERFAVAVDERNVVGAATSQYDAKILGQSAMTHDASAIQMAARLVHFP